jgi:hypothetical protein
VTIGNSVTSIGRLAFSGCSALGVVYYMGTEEAWNKISIESNNTILTSAERYYYSEIQPTSEGYWHYVDGVPTLWKPHDHNYSTSVVSPTCTEKGYTIHTCIICGDEYIDSYTDALGHNYANGTCTRCGEKK